MCWEARQRIVTQLSQLQFEAIVNDFLSWLVLVKIKGNLVFNFMYDRFWFDGDFFVRNQDASTELQPVPVAFIKDCFPFLDGMVLFPSPLGPFFSFFTKDFLPLLIFPWANIFPKSKSFHVWILSNARCKQNMQITWKTRPKMSLPQGIRSWTRLRHLPDLLTLVWKYVFLINSGVLKISEFFLRKRKVKCLNSV